MQLDVAGGWRGASSLHPLTVVARDTFTSLILQLLRAYRAARGFREREGATLALQRAVARPLCAQRTFRRDPAYELRIASSMRRDH